MQQPLVGIVVLNWNRREDTLDCLASLSKLDYPAFQVIVVDNGSTDGSVEAIRSAFPTTVLIETGANLGYAAGNNVGLRYAFDHACELALLLNNDTVVAPDLLTQMTGPCLADSTIGVVGPKIYYYDRPQVFWSAGGVIDWQHGRTFMRGIEEQDCGQFDAPAAADFVTGCALLVRRAAAEAAGLLDERFFMYFEETEWCVRIARAGWRIMYVPGGRLWHKIKPAAQDQSPYVMYYMPRNRLLFLRLTGASWRTWLHAALCQDFKHWCIWHLPRNWGKSTVKSAALRAAWRDFLLGRFGMATQQQLFGGQPARRAAHDPVRS
jgi:GT2 family glycosyltransferase